MFEEMDANVYALSSDSPEHHVELKEEMGFTFEFLSDPSMDVIEKADMKGQETSVRGYSVFDENGELITSEEDDYWGENINDTAEKINNALE
ncbi:AhpC/TSA family protein [Alteribacillus iranensis]|uniref:AhpC/TSA family protein n=1 Tax=Alteribacillus iranensis TaxID=930128 RepID=A0A1I2CX80_9BACI|nr:AhpC/TSA family protein [Alteribacillus iranensis]